MTREEREQALEWFKNRPITMPGAKKMYDLAFEALSADGDTISRQAAIDVLDKNHILGRGDLNEVLDHIVERLDKLPSAQPETHEERTETHGVCLDTISRKAAIDAIMDADVCVTWNGVISDDDAVDIAIKSTKGSVISSIVNMPSAQPEHTNSCYTNSWCIDCKEYDTENKCCPRYNRVIKQTLDDAYRHGETEAEARFYAEIVRCKDCNHWSRESICDGFCSEDCMRHDEDFYCGYAERKTNE